MASITIRKLDESIKARLRVRAAQHKRSMEDEARKILRAALVDETAMERSLADAIHGRFGAIGGVDLRLPPRDAIQSPPKPGR
jgi:antitoxin FitA